MSDGIKFIPTSDNRAPMLEIEMQDSASARFLLLNKGSADYVRISHEQIPRVIAALQALRVDPMRPTLPPEPTMKSQIIAELALVFPRVDAADGAVVYNDPSHQGIYSTQRSLVWSEPAYKSYGDLALYRNGVHHLLAEWLETKGWHAVLQPRGCQFYPITYKPL